MYNVIFTKLSLIVLNLLLLDVDPVNDTDGGTQLERNEAKSSAVCRMEINPIYEGVIYETTPGESFKPLLTASSRTASTTSLADPAPRYAKRLPNCHPHVQRRDSEMLSLQAESLTNKHLESVKEDVNDVTVTSFDPDLPLLLNDSLKNDDKVHNVILMNESSTPSVNKGGMIEPSSTSFI